MPGSGFIRTSQSFGDCQLHVEWAAPNPPHGDSQGRGNSGVFFGYDRYEVQVLDCFHQKSRRWLRRFDLWPVSSACECLSSSGKWQTYDINSTAPR